MVTWLDSGELLLLHAKQWRKLNWGIVLGGLCKRWGNELPLLMSGNIHVTQAFHVMEVWEVGSWALWSFHQLSWHLLAVLRFSVSSHLGKVLPALKRWHWDSIGLVGWQYASLGHCFPLSRRAVCYTGNQGSAWLWSGVALARVWSNHFIIWGLALLHTSPMNTGRKILYPFEMWFSFV